MRDADGLRCECERSLDREEGYGPSLSDVFLRRSGEISWRNGRNRNAFCEGVLRPEEPHDEPMLEGEFSSAEESSPRLEDSLSTLFVSAARASQPSSILCSIARKWGESGVTK